MNINDVLDSLPEENKSRKVVLPDISGEVVMNAIRRLKEDGFSPVICGTTEELQLYREDTANGLEFIQVPEGENKLIFAARQVFEKKVYGFLGGNNEETGVTISSIIKAKKELNLPIDRMTSHFLSEIGGRIILLADCALKNHDSPEAYMAVAEQSVEAAKKYGLKDPSIAMLSYATNPPVIGEGEKGYDREIADMQRAVSLLKEKYGQKFPVEGPAQMDAVMKPEVAIKKNPETIFGEDRPDIIIYPNLAAGNSGYKTLNLMGAQTLGPILSGTLHDLSRSATADDIYNSVRMNVL